MTGTSDVPDDLHPWDVSPGEAREIQLRLAGRVERAPPAGFSPRLVAGADLSVGRGETRGHAALVSVELPSLETVEVATASAPVTFPYVAGLLSFREMPPLLRAWERLERRPDVVLFDAHGLAHPRRFGLACHGGVWLDVPAVGCAKSVLVGDHREPDRSKGARSPLRHEGEVVGTALRTRDDVRPVFVSVGHRMDLGTAEDLVLRVSPRYRIPEPIRRADRKVGEMRREAL